MSVGARNEVRSRRMLIAAGAASVVCWYLPGAALIAYPIRLFVTLLHEAAHALVTIITGGEVVRIALFPSGSGITESMGGMQMLIYPAGYVGATAAGAGFLLLCRRIGGNRVLSVMAVTVLMVTILWVRNPFGVLAGMVTAGFIGIAAYAMTRRVAEFAAGFLAVQLCLNAILDVRGLVWLASATDVPNDAVFMARAFGLAPWFWAVLWSAASVVVLIWALRTYWQPRSRG